MLDDQSVRYSLLSRNRTTLPGPTTGVLPMSNIPSGRPPRAMIYARLDEAIEALDSRLGGLPRPAEAEDIWDDLWHQEAHHSTALEGNTLILDQVRKLLDEGRAVGSKELREYMEVKGYADAARWVYGQGVEPGDWTSRDLLSLQEVRSVHHKAMTPVWAVAARPHAREPLKLAGARDGPLPRRNETAALPRRCPPDAGLGEGRQHAPRPGRADTASGAAGSRAQHVRAHPPVPRREREYRPTAAQPDPGAPRIRARHHLQERTHQVQNGRASGRE